MKNYAQSPSKKHRQVQLRRALDAPDYRSDSVGSPLNPTVKSHRDNPEVRARLAALQMRRRGQAEVGAQTSDEVHALAGDGIAGSGGALPHQAAIQASFGHHDISNIQAHTDSRALQATEALGARGYAAGSHVAFSGQPTLHTAAHEAAHVVQQRAGVHLKGGIGAEGDVYERHADAVAERVVAGKSATDLLDGIQSGGSGAGLQFSLDEGEESQGTDSASSSTDSDDQEQGGEQKKEVAPKGPQRPPRPVSEMRPGTGPLALEEVPRPLQKRLGDDANRFAHQGKSWDDTMTQLLQLMGPRFSARDARTFFDTAVYPKWLEGLKQWARGPLRSKIDGLGREAGSWDEVWAKLEPSCPRGGIRGGVDIEGLAKEQWEASQSDGPTTTSSAAPTEAGGQKNEFKFDNPKTWQLLPFRDQFGVVGKFGPARGLVPPLQAGHLGEMGQRGPDSRAQISKPFMATIGEGAVAFAYRHDGDRKVSPMIYDFARSPNRKDPKKWDWEFGGTWAGPPAAP